MGKFILSVLFHTDDGMDTCEQRQLVGCFDQGYIDQAKKDWLKEQSDLVDEEIVVENWWITPIGSDGKVTDYPRYQDP